MYCNKCGAQLVDNSRYCHNCGQPVQSGSRELVPAPSVSESAVVPAESPTPVLVWGILGLAFAVSGPLSFLGIIFSCIGRGKAREYIDKYGTVSRQAVVGKNLSKAGLIVGIVMTVLVVLYILFWIVMVGLILKYGQSSGQFSY